MDESNIIGNKYNNYNYKSTLTKVNNPSIIKQVLFWTISNSINTGYYSRILREMKTDHVCSISSRFSLPACRIHPTPILSPGGVHARILRFFRNPRPPASCSNLFQPNEECGSSRVCSTGTPTRPSPFFFQPDRNRAPYPYTSCRLCTQCRSRVLRRKPVQ